VEDAFRIAHGDLVMWLAEEHGLDKLDAYQLVTQISESPVANVCDPNYTLVAKAPKRYLPNGDVYRSTRARLKEMAAEHLRERGRGSTACGPFSRSATTCPMSSTSPPRRSTRSASRTGTSTRGESPSGPRSTTSPASWSWAAR